MRGLFLRLDSLAVHHHNAKGRTTVAMKMKITRIEWSFMLFRMLKVTSEYGMVQTIQSSGRSLP
jgi:hypothetical protein